MYNLLLFENITYVSFQSYNSLIFTIVNIKFWPFLYLINYEQVKTIRSLFENICRYDPYKILHDHIRCFNILYKRWPKYKSVFFFFGKKKGPGPHSNLNGSCTQIRGKDKGNLYPQSASSGDWTPLDQVLLGEVQKCVDKKIRIV